LTTYVTRSHAQSCINLALFWFRAGDATPQGRHGFSPTRRWLLAPPPGARGVMRGPYMTWVIRKGEQPTRWILTTFQTKLGNMTTAKGSSPSPALTISKSLFNEPSFRTMTSIRA
jgi:hypothetical protein